MARRATGSEIGIFRPPGPHALTPLGRTVLIGRSDTAHVLVLDQAVSTLHAAIIAAGDRWQLRDLGSRNGTYVNGARVTDLPLRAGDTIQVGGTSFRFTPTVAPGELGTGSFVVATGGQAGAKGAVDPGATLALTLPADPADALLAAGLQDPPALSALTHLSSLFELATSRHELLRFAVSIIADAFTARHASAWRPGPNLAQEAAWGEEAAGQRDQESLLSLALSRRQGTTSAIATHGFGAALALVSRRSVLGALYLERSVPFARKDLELLSIFATKLAFALENDALTQQLKAANEELRASNARLEDEVARRTADVKRLSEQRRELLGMVAHDVRGALTFVKLLADTQVLKGRGVSDPIALETLEQIGARARRTTDLLSGLLDAEALAEGTIKLVSQPVNLADVASSLVGPLRPWAEARKLALAVEAPHPVVAFADPARVEQVVQNLLANAIKNTTQGGIVVTVEAGDGRALVAVQDTGRGIPPEALERIFKPFAESDEATGRPRLGLGLAIARRLVTLMGGTISVESAVGKGTTFRFDLPLAPPA